MNIGFNLNILLDVAQRIDEQVDALIKNRMGKDSEEIEQLHSVSASLRRKHEIIAAVDRELADGK